MKGIDEAHRKRSKLQQLMSVKLPLLPLQRKGLFSFSVHLLLIRPCWCTITCSE